MILTQFPEFELMVYDSSKHGRLLDPRSVNWKCVQATSHDPSVIMTGQLAAKPDLKLPLFIVYCRFPC